MALFNRDVATGLAIGLGAALLAPAALALLGGAGRPAARAAVKAGLLAYEKGLDTFAELGETVEDLLAEAQAEIEAEREEPTATAAAEAEETDTDAGPSVKTEEKASKAPPKAATKTRRSAAAGKSAT